jgi:hypothetical protein
MNPAFKVMGASSGGHLTYGSMTCLGYAGGFTSNGAFPLIPQVDPAAAASAPLTLGSTSEWVAVEAGKHYYIQGYHLEKNGGDYYTVSVEIESSTGAAHHHSMKEVQDVSVDTDVVLEKTALTITAADGLLYILNFQNPVTLLFWKTDRIPVGCNEW